MGPLFFRAENAGSSSSASPPATTFNGAALFQSGEPSRSRNTCGSWPPSMGPLFFRAENIAPAAVTQRASRSFNGAALFQSGEHRWDAAAKRTEETLQWGRSFSERRTGSFASTPLTNPALLQWGRSFSERRTTAVPRGGGPAAFLQWGRSFSERRTSCRSSRRAW